MEHRRKCEQESLHFDIVNVKTAGSSKRRGFVYARCLLADKPKDGTVWHAIVDKYKPEGDTDLVLDKKGEFSQKESEYDGFESVKDIPAWKLHEMQAGVHADTDTVTVYADGTVKIEERGVHSRYVGPVTWSSKRPDPDRYDVQTREQPPGTYSDDSGNVVRCGVREKGIPRLPGQVVTLKGCGSVFVNPARTVQLVPKPQAGGRAQRQAPTVPPAPQHTLFGPDDRLHVWPGGRVHRIPLDAVTTTDKVEEWLTLLADGERKRSLRVLQAKWHPDSWVGADGEAQALARNIEAGDFLDLALGLAHGLSRRS